MPIIRLETVVRAPVVRCFDLSRSVDLHVAAASHTGERAVAGVTSGLMALGDRVTWRARHFGIWQKLTTEITAFDPPRYFRDSMLRGAFARFDHDHVFEAIDAHSTLMKDAFDFDAPLGALGRVVSRLVLTNYMRRFLLDRNATLVRVAESTEWRSILPD